MWSLRQTRRFVSPCPSAGVGSGASELDQPFPVKRRDLDGAELTLQHVQSRGLGPTRWLTDRRHVFDVKSHQLSELRQPTDPGADGGFVAVHRQLG